MDDDQAIAPDKTALLPGDAATFANVTSYSRGINAVIVDVDRLGGVPTVEDFEFKVGNNDDPSGWDDAPDPIDISVRRGDGIDGADRVTILWDDNAVQKQWLQVVALPNVRTGLAEPDVFYFGNAIGDTGNDVGLTTFKVNVFDMLAARDNQRNFLAPAPIDFAVDFNRDALVTAADMLIARENHTHFLNALRQITVPGTKDGKRETEMENVSARNAVLEQAADRESGSRRDSLGKLDWLYEFEQMSLQKRSSAKGDSAKEVVDEWFAQHSL